MAPVADATRDKDVAIVQRFFKLSEIRIDRFLPQNHGLAMVFHVQFFSQGEFFEYLSNRNLPFEASSLNGYGFPVASTRNVSWLLMSEIS